MVEAGAEVYLGRSPTNFLQAKRNLESHYSPAPENARGRPAGSDDNALHPSNSALTGRYQRRTSGCAKHDLAAVPLPMGRRHSPAPEESLGYVSRPIRYNAAWIVAQRAVGEGG